MYYRSALDARIAAQNNGKDGTAKAIDAWIAAAEKDPMLVWVDSRELFRDYQTDIREICQCLQASRSWAQTHIKPAIHHIRVGANARQYVEGPARVLYNTTEWHDLLLSARKERRSKLIYLENLLDDDELSDWYATRCEIYRDVTSRRADVCAQADAGHMTPADANDELTQIDQDERAAIDSARLTMALNLERDGRVPGGTWLQASKRSAAEWVATGEATTLVDAQTWRTAADMKDYGDTDEEVHRQIFSTGQVRHVLSIDGVERILYVADSTPDVLRSRDNVTARFPDVPSAVFDGTYGVVSAVGWHDYTGSW